MNNPVADYYDLNAKNEWNRLFLSPYRRIEYEVIHYFLSKYLPESGRVLDLGGGPGRYSISLAKLGYKMTLLDISVESVQLARKKINAAGITEHIENISVADAKHLDHIPSNGFDAVLCMGPLYHMPKLNDRLKCLAECNRVMKTNAPVFVTVIPRWTFIRDALRSGSFEEVCQNTPTAFNEIIQYGTSKESRVPSMHYCHTDEVHDWFTSTGYQIKEMASTHGLASFMDEQVEKISQDAETWKTLMELIFSSCTDSASLSSAEYILVIAKKVENDVYKALVF